MTAHTKSFHELAEHYRLPSEIAKRFGDLYESDPYVARSLLRNLQDIVGDEVDASNANRLSTRPTNADRVVEYFKSIGNQWQTKDQIREGAGLSDAAIHTVLYSTGKGRFETLRNLDGGKAAGFRLMEHEDKPHEHNHDTTTETTESN